MPKLCSTARMSTVLPTVTTGASSLRSVTARFSPPDLPRSITTERGLRSSTRASTRLAASAPSGGPPARGLQVGQEHNLLLGDRRDLEHAVDRLERRGQVGAAVRDRQLVDLL